MFYHFPIIHSIRDVEYAIRDDHNFDVKTKNGFIVIDYILSFKDTFPPIQGINDAIRRECRGLIFDADSGKIVRRPYHKFFNLGEREETLNPPLSEHLPTVLEKLDGSMVAPFFKKDGDPVLWGTRAGVTEVSEWARMYIVDHRRTMYYESVASLLMTMGYTPIFEWMSPHNRVVLKHEESSLVLTAIRNMTNGQYLSLRNLEKWGRIGNIPVVNRLATSRMNTIRDETDIEGIVARFDNGHMLKVKSSWYCRIHKAKDEMRFEKDIIAMLLDGRKDDVYPFLTDDLKKKFDEYETNFWFGMTQTIGHLVEIFKVIGTMDRKEFALKLSTKFSKMELSIIYHCWETRDWQSIRESIIKTIRKKLFREITVNDVRVLWNNNAYWNYNG